MLIKKSNYTYRIKFTNPKLNPLIFCLKSGVEVKVVNNYDCSLFHSRRELDCTVYIKHINISNVCKLYTMFNSVLNTAILGKGFGSDYRIDLEIKKRNQIVRVYNVTPDFNNYGSFISQSQPHYIDIEMKGNCIEYFYDYNGDNVV